MAAAALALVAVVVLVAAAAAGTPGGKAKPTAQADTGPAKPTKAATKPYKKQVQVCMKTVQAQMLKEAKGSVKVCPALYMYDDCISTIKGLPPKDAQKALAFAQVRKPLCTRQRSVHARTCVCTPSDSS